MTPKRKTPIRKEVESSEGEETQPTPAQNHEACPFLVQIPAVIDIDERGDRILVVGTNQCKIMADGSHEHKEEAKSFRVCSRALARSSPVMRAMLFGKFIEATQDTINLPEDDPGAMETLLQISHGNLTAVHDFTLHHDVGQPDPSFVDEVYKMAALANKYLMSHHLRTWANIWPAILLRGDRLFPACSPADRYKKLEKSLFIAHFFGNLNLYAVVFSDLVWLQQKDQELFAHSIEPDGASDGLRKVRLQHIKNILDPIRQAIDTFLDENDSSLYACNQGPQNLQNRCKAYALGALMRGLNKESLWPLPDPESVLETPQDFFDKCKRNLWSDYTPIHSSCPISHALVKQMNSVMPRLQEEFIWPPRSVVDSLLVTAKEFGFHHVCPAWFKTEGPELKYNCLLRKISEKNTVSWQLARRSTVMCW